MLLTALKRLMTQARYARPLVARGLLFPNSFLNVHSFITNIESFAMNIPISIANAQLISLI